MSWPALLRNRLLNAIYPENGNKDVNKGKKSTTPLKSQPSRPHSVSKHCHLEPARHHKNPVAPSLQTQPPWAAGLATGTDSTS